MKSKSLLVTELDVQDLLHILTAVDGGDFSKRLPDSYVGVERKIADKLNSIIQKNALLNQELKRIGKDAETEESESIRHYGHVTQMKQCQPIILKRVSGTWRDSEDDLSFKYTNHT